MKLTALKRAMVAGVAVAVLVASANGVLAEVPNSPEVLAISANIDNDTFDRATIRVGTREPYWMAVYDTLVHLSPDGELLPGLATTWAWSEGNKALTLTLREGVQFTDGASFDAEAVRANLLALRDGNGENAFMLASVTDVEVKDANQVILHLSAPDPALPENLSTVAGAIASPASIGATEAATHPIGSGPYVLDAQETVPGRQYVYRKNTDYWNAEATEFETLTITPISDLSARLNALRAGQVDAVLAEASVVAEAEASGLKVTTFPVDWEGILIADRDGAVVPALGDPRVRKAINLAIDKESILHFMRAGYGQVTTQIFSPNSSAFVASLDGQYGFDVEQARQLMADAGYADGFSVTLPELRLFAAFTPVITQMLGDIGIKTEWVPVAPTEAIAELQSGKFAIFPVRLAAQSSWSDIRRVVASDASWNVLHSQNAALDALVAAAQGAPSEPDQIATYRQINEWLVDQAWFAPWYRVDTVILTNDEVTVRPRPGSVAPSVQYFSVAQ